MVYHMKENPMTYSESIKTLQKRVLQDCLISLPGPACFGHFVGMGFENCVCWPAHETAAPSLVPAQLPAIHQLWAWTIAWFTCRCPISPPSPGSASQPKRWHCLALGAAECGGRARGEQCPCPGVPIANFAGGRLKYLLCVSDQFSSPLLFLF